jgi:hypothetical protein
MLAHRECSSCGHPVPNCNSVSHEHGGHASKYVMTWELRSTSMYVVYVLDCDD